MLCALIMAGGKGERFWPLSTDEKPKQFLKLLGEDTMLQMTVKRINKLVPMERIFIVTGKRYIPLIKEQLHEIPDRNIIIEPTGRNTAPCITYSALMINKYYGDAEIVVLPSDHLISGVDKFIDVLNISVEFIRKHTDSVVTIGIKPNRPETGYGYIKLGSIEEQKEEVEVRKVERFVEKPDEKRAKAYLAEGKYLWNGGMFVWKVSTILELNKKYLPQNYEILSEIAAARDDEFENVLEDRYKDLESISIDFGIMEKINNIYVVTADFGWDDIGSWYSLERYREKDRNNNVCIGDILSIESKNNIIIGNKKPIVLAGLSDVFVVETDDLILVGNKEKINAIKEIKKKATEDK